MTRAWPRAHRCSRRGASRRRRDAATRSADVPTREPPRELVREQDVAELRGAVHAHRRIASLRLQVARVEARELVGVGGHVHDPRARPFEQAGQQVVGQQEGRQVVHREGGLEPVGCLTATQHRDAGVVQQHVDPLEPLVELGSHAPDVVEPLEVGQEDPDAVAPRVPFDAFARRFGPLGGAGDDRYVGARLRQGQCGGLAQAGRRARDHAGLAVHVVLVIR